MVKVHSNPAGLSDNLNKLYEIYEISEITSALD